LSWTVYKRAQPYYVAHLYYAIHFHAFVFLMLAFKVAFGLLGTAGAVVGGLFPLTVAPYHYMALRRVFGGTGREVAWKGTLIALVYTVLIVAIMFALLLWTIRNTVVGPPPKGLHLP